MANSGQTRRDSLTFSKIVCQILKAEKRKIIRASRNRTFSGVSRLTVNVKEDDSPAPRSRIAQMKRIKISLGVSLLII